MICLIQYLFWKGTGKVMECKGKDCRFYGGDACYAAERHSAEQTEGES